MIAPQTRVRTVERVSMESTLTTVRVWRDTPESTVARVSTEIYIMNNLLCFVCRILLYLTIRIRARNFYRLIE